MKNWTILLAMLAMFGFAITGCEEEAAEETETPAAEGEGEEATEEEATEEEATEEEAAEETAEEGGDDSTCGRARACCEAFVEATNAMAAGSMDAETTCGTIASVEGTPTADSSCQTMIDGYRQSLEALPNAEVPDSCAAAE